MSSRDSLDVRVGVVMIEIAATAVGVVKEIAKSLVFLDVSALRVLAFASPTVHPCNQRGKVLCELRRKAGLKLSKGVKRG